MTNPYSSERWYSKLLQPRLPWYKRPMRPADISEGLCSAMLSRESTLEDVDYSRIVPNRFIVEVNPENYTRNFQPIESRVRKQWTDRLLACLLTTNSRQGRRAYRLGGPVQIDIRPAPDLDPSQVRVLARILPESSQEKGQTAPSAGQACLEQYGSGQRWRLRPGTTTLGRDEGSDIVLNQPEVQEMRLVSGQHAHLQVEESRIWVYDGSTSGRPSINGTYVNGRRVPPEGAQLRDGDLLVLAAIDPLNPRPDTPGVTAFYFFRSCS